MSSAYNPASNGAAERGVGQIIGLLEKIGRKNVLSQDDLNRLVFKLNSNITTGQGSALQRFFGRKIGTRVHEEAAGPCGLDSEEI